MQVQILLLFPMAFLLPPRAGAGEIIGGREARPHSKPYMAFLHVHRGKETFRCGGFLVGKDFVLTAAHCQADRINVTLGAHNIRRQEPSQEVIQVQRQIPHPRYNRKTFNNDIMLLQLSTKATLTKDVGLLLLTNAGSNLSPGTVCNVAGWGMTSLNKSTDTLWEVNLSVESDDLCENRYHSYFPSTMLCVGNPRYRKSIYMGDSGGPLVCNGVAEGIVSKGKKKNTNPPVVLTRISHFVPWIKANMQ